MRFPRVLAALALMAPSAAAAAGVEIQHAPVACAPADRYVRVSASAVPPEDVAGAELQFRGSATGGWYSVRMAAEGGAWSAVLPRPIRPLESFEYRIVMWGADLQVTETAASPVRVAGDPSGCAGGPQFSIEVEAPIVVRVPAGAPPVPPVPRGFSPAGVVAATDPELRKSQKRAWIAGAGVAAGIGALVAGAGSRPPELPVVPDFAFFGTFPTPGGDFSISRDRLSVFVRVSGDPREPVTITWVFGLRTPGRLEACLTMFDTVTIGPERPVTVELSSPVRVSGFCGALPYTVDSGKLSIVVNGHLVRDDTQALPFRIVP